MPTLSFFDWLSQTYSSTTAYQHLTTLRALLRHAGLPDAPDGPFPDLHPEAIMLRARRVHAAASPAAQRNYVGAWNRWTQYLAAVHGLTVPGLTLRTRAQDLRAGGTEAPPQLPAVVLQAVLTLLRPPVRIGSTRVPPDVLAAAWWGDVDTHGRVWNQSWAGLRLWFRTRTGDVQYLDTDATLPWFVLAAWASGVAHPLTRPADHVPLVPSARGGLRSCTASQLASVLSYGLAPLPAVPQAPTGLTFYGDSLRLELDPWAGPPSPMPLGAPQMPVGATQGFDLGASLARMATQPTVDAAREEPAPPSMDELAPLETFSSRPPDE